MRTVFLAIVITFVGLCSCNPSLEELRSLSTEKQRELELHRHKIDRKNKEIDSIFGGLIASAVKPSLGEVNTQVEYTKNFGVKYEKAQASRARLGDFDFDDDETKYDKFKEVFFGGDSELFIQMVIALDEELRLIVPKTGGVADRVYTMSPDELMMSALETAQELDDNGVKLDIPELIKKHHDRIRYAEEAKKRAEGVKSSRKNLRVPVSSIVDLMKVVSIEQLQALTIIADEITRKFNHKSGGVAERINNMTREEMYEVIIESFRLYPEILALNNLDSLYEEFGERIRFTREFKDIAKSNKNLKSKKELNVIELIRAQPRENLIIIATALEAFERETTGQVLFGGIHDNVSRLTNEDIFIFIKDILDRFPQLLVLENIEKVLEKYTN